MVYSVLIELKAKYPHIRYTVVLAYMPDEHIKELYGKNTLFPDGMESVPKRFAISKRNDWIIQQSGFAVCYVHKITGVRRSSGKLQRQNRIRIQHSSAEILGAYIIVSKRYDKRRMGLL